MSFFKSLLTVGTIALLAGCGGSGAEGDETSDDALSGSPNASAAPSAARPQTWADAYRCDEASAFKIRMTASNAQIPTEIAKPNSAAAIDAKSLYSIYTPLAPFMARLVWDWTTKVNGPQGQKHFVVVASQLSSVTRYQVPAGTDGIAAFVQVYDDDGALVMSGIGHAGDVLPENIAMVDAYVQNLQINYIDWQDQPTPLAALAKALPKKPAAPIARKSCPR